jgi:hypothetical protein
MVFWGMRVKEKVKRKKEKGSGKTSNATTSMAHTFAFLLK